MKVGANAVTKEIKPDEVKIKAAIRIMVAVAMRILDKQKRAG